MRCARARIRRARPEPKQRRASRCVTIVVVVVVVRRCAWLAIVNDDDRAPRSIETTHRKHIHQTCTHTRAQNSHARVHTAVSVKSVARSQVHFDYAPSTQQHGRVVVVVAAGERIAESAERIERMRSKARPERGRERTNESCVCLSGSCVHANRIAAQNAEKLCFVGVSLTIAYVACFLVNAHEKGVIHTSESNVVGRRVFEAK